MSVTSKVKLENVRRATSLSTRTTKTRPHVLLGVLARQLNSSWQLHLLNLIHIVFARLHME